MFKATFSKLCICIFFTYYSSCYPLYTGVVMKIFHNCRAPRPVPSCLVPYLSLTCPLPVPYPFLTCPLPVPYPSLTHLASLGLSRSHKGTGTDTIFDFSHPPTTRKLYRTLYSPFSILYRDGWISTDLMKTTNVQTVYF